MGNPVYLDHAATTPLDPEVRAALAPYLESEFGNPSSRHRLGQRAADAVESARREVARALGCRPAEVVLTSGGTEANALGVLGGARARARRGRHVVVGPTEHACVRESARALATEGFEVATARLDAGGALDLDHLASLLRSDTVLVAQMLVQNEFGSVYPLARVARLVRAHAPAAALHVDAVQALGKLELSLAALGADTVAVSAHKVHGPKGAGALAVAADARLAPLIPGGGQERGLRGGTENVPAIVGFGAAARLARERIGETRARCQALRARLAVGLARIEGARLLEPGSPGAPGEQVAPAIAAFAVPGGAAEGAMHHLEQRGVVVGAGSACQARKQETSPALLALGLSPEEARSVLRISFARTTTPEDVDRALEALLEVRRSLAGARR